MLEILKCQLCGKLAMIVREGGKRTICCDQLMEKLVEKHLDVHSPAIEKKGDHIKVVVPGVADPMKSGHYIEWVEVFDGPYLHVKGFKPGDAPQAEFMVNSPRVKIRTYCEEHGLCSNRPSKR
jgi:superoxide reductase